MSLKTKKLIRALIDLVVMAVLVLLDMYSKRLAVIYLKDKAPIVLAQGVFELNYLENRGAAFGMMQNMKYFFLAVAIVMVLFVVYALFKMPLKAGYFVMRMCFVMIGAGAIGNMIDRLTTEYVVDFFYFSLINFPIFNVADVYVTCACILLILCVLFFYKESDMAFLKPGSDKTEE